MMINQCLDILKVENWNTENENHLHIKRLRRIQLFYTGSAISVVGQMGL